MASNASRQTAGFNSSGGVRFAAPAEFTRMSIGPSRSSTVSIILSAATASDEIGDDAKRFFELGAGFVDILAGARTDGDPRAFGREA